MSHEKDMIDMLGRKDDLPQAEAVETKEGLEIRIGSRKRELPSSLKTSMARDASGYMCGDDWP